MLEVKTICFARSTTGNTAGKITALKQVPKVRRLSMNYHLLSGV